MILAGISSLVLTLGIARFAYTPLLPVMQDQTALNDALGGWIATFNYIGYMLGALIAASISDLRLKDTLYRVGLITAVMSTLGMAWTENWILWSLLRFLAGLSSAAGLLIGSGLILNLIRPARSVVTDVSFVERNRRLEPVLRVCYPDHREASLPTDRKSKRPCESRTA